MAASLLERAQGGDGDAFGMLVAPHRRELHLHCYRMLGSLADADDVLQDTLVAAWRGMDGFAGRSSLRTWLYAIATNRCLNAIRDAKRRPPPVPTPPFDPPRTTSTFEATWLQPYPDAWLARPSDPQGSVEATDAIRLAFVAALQRLAPRQAAALLLCAVVGFTPTEVAAMLDTTPVAVKGLVQRARGALVADRRRSPVYSADGDSSEVEEVARRFAEAYRTDDVEGLVALLTDDAWLAMPPAPHLYCGTAAIAGFLRSSAAGRGGRRLGLVPTRANTQPAFVCYLGEPEHPDAQPSGVVVLDTAGDRVAGITRFLDPSLVGMFLPGGDAAAVAGPTQRSCGSTPRPSDGPVRPPAVA